MECFQGKPWEAPPTRHALYIQKLPLANDNPRKSHNNNKKNAAVLNDWHQDARGREIFPPGGGQPPLWATERNIYSEGKWSKEHTQKKTPWIEDRS